MSTPLISIIVPAYNSADTIERCVDSIKGQTVTDWELIIADNGSTDGCTALCRQLAEADSRIRVIEVTKRGVSAARNAALDIARGEYVCFVDSDDAVELDYIGQLLADCNADLTVCGYFVDRVTCGGEQIKSEAHTAAAEYWTAGKDKLVLVPASEAGFMHLCCNKLFRRGIIERNHIRFKPYPVNEDYIFTLTFLLHANSVFVIDKPLYHWIRVEGMLTGVKSIPDNLLSIYNESHAATRKFFGDDSIADRIAYFSYEMIVYKYYEALRCGRLTKQDTFRKIKELIHNKLVKDAYNSYKPQSKGEALLYALLKARLLRIHYYLAQKILR